MKEGNKIYEEFDGKEEGECFKERKKERKKMR